MTYRNDSHHVFSIHFSFSLITLMCHAHIPIKVVLSRPPSISCRICSNSLTPTPVAPYLACISLVSPWCTAVHSMLISLSWLCEILSMEPRWPWMPCHTLVLCFTSIPSCAAMQSASNKPFIPKLKRQFLWRFPGGPMGHRIVAIASQPQFLVPWFGATYCQSS